MPLNTNATQRRSEFDRQLAGKLAFEAKLEPKIRRLLGQIVEDVQRNYVESGFLLDAAVYRSALEQILFDHYIDVGDSFGSVLTVGLPSSDNIIVPAVARDVIDQNLTALFAAQARIDAEFIIKTTNKVISDKYAAAIAMDEQSRAEDVAAGVSLALTTDAILRRRKEIAGDASSLIDDNFGARPELIALTETQIAAEESKQIELEALIAFGAITAAIIRKIWESMRDDRVRHAHEEAQSQSQIVTSPFTVGGELLMYPGDRSLGASDGNIIRCRCASVTRIG